MKQAKAKTAAIFLAIIAILAFAPLASAAVPDVYRSLAQDYVKALTEGDDSGLCNDDDSDGDLGGEAPLFVVGAIDPGKDG